MAVDRIGTFQSGLGSRYQNLTGGSPALTTVYSPPADQPTDQQGTRGAARHWEDSFGQIEYAVNVALFSGRNHPTEDPESLVHKAIVQAFGTAAGNAPSAAQRPTAARRPASGSDQFVPDSADDSPAMQAYHQSLAAHGVSPKKFHDDLVAAVADAQQGRIDPTRVFGNFPIGSSVDAFA